MRLERVGAAAVLLAAGCASAPRQTADEREYHRYGPLEVSAVVEIDVSDIMGAVDLMNPSAERVTVSYAGECGAAVLIYHRDDMNVSPLWDSSRWWASRGECPSGTTRMEIPPRTLARILTPVVTAGRVLGDSLPAGAYRTGVRLRLLEPLDTILVLPGGEIHLESDSGVPGLAASEQRLQPWQDKRYLSPQTDS